MPRLVACSQDVGEDALRSVTIWTALDPTTEANGALQIVPGSHTRGKLETRPWGDAPKNTIAESIPVPIEWLDQEPIHLEMSMGEVVLLHNHVVHKSDPNSTAMPRRALSTWYTKRSMPGDAGRCQIFPEYIPAVYPAPKL
jgi:phytanoyl-CoA hydroxylase